MTITGALLLFLSLFAGISLLLALYGVNGTLYAVSLCLLFGLIMKVRLRRRMDTPLDTLQKVPEDLRSIPGMEGIRQWLQENNFAFHRSLIFDDIGRYAEIYTCEGVFAELIYDGDDGPPILRFQSFFDNGDAIVTQSGGTEEETDSRFSYESHCLPGRNRQEQLQAHRLRVEHLCREGGRLEAPPAENIQQFVLREKNRE